MTISSHRDFLTASSPQTLSALLDASAAINSDLDLDRTLQAIAAAAAAVLRAQASSVIMLDNVRGKQVFRAAVGKRSDQLIGMEFDATAGIAGKVLATGQAVVANDVASEKSHYKDFDLRLDFQTHSLIAAPLIHNGEQLGVVEIINPVDSHRFDEHDRRVAQIFANLAAIAVVNAQLHDRLRKENRSLRSALRPAEELIGDSAEMKKVTGLIRRVAPSATTVLLSGETGTGKELAAQMIHAHSKRAERPFIPVNCAALPETLLESELFGHEAGAFTGATGKKLGRFELADGGTIFLDEIGDVAMSIQVKLLRVLQEKQIVRVGGTKTISCDVRVVAATNRDLADETRKGRFRQDLFYRINVFPIEIPPLRVRRRDIGLLAEHFIRRLAGEMNSDTTSISPEAMEMLRRYDYPGNIRELQNILERACLLCCCLGDDGDAEHTILPEHLPREVQQTLPDDAEADSVLAQGEKALILNALREHGWNQTRAARSLGVSRDNIRYRIKKYGLRKK